MKKLYGVTHNTDSGEAIIRIPRAIKVSIGMSKGPDISVKILPDGRWSVRIGDGGSKAVKVEKFTDMAEAKTFYNQNRAAAPERKYPGKLPYFTFSRTGSDGSYEPDWETTAAYGSMPTAIPIFFTSNDPLDAEMQLWTASELRCHGDGINASRLVTQPQGFEAAAKAAADRGEKYYQIEEGCAQRGCVFAQPNSKGKKGPCGPKGNVFFQLGYTPIIGVTSYLSTTGKTSISQLFSCLETIKQITGRGNPDAGTVAGVPLWLVVKEFRSKTPTGEKATFWGVHVEYRSGSGGRAGVFEELMDASGASESIQATLPPGPEIQATATHVVDGVDDRLGSESVQAHAHQAEFSGDIDDIENAEDGDDGCDGAIVDDDDIVVTTPTPPPPAVKDLRQALSKSVQEQQKRSERLSALAKKVGLQGHEILTYVVKQAGVTLTQGKKLTPEEDGRLNAAIAVAEMTPAAALQAAAKTPAAK